MDTKVRVVKVSKKGALLVTDEIKVVWIQKRSLRENGTLTPRGEREFNKSEVKLKDWERDSLAKINVTIDRRDFLPGTKRAWQIRTNQYIEINKQYHRMWDYFPKSEVKILKITSDNIVVKMPLWLYKKSYVNREM